MDGHPSIMCEIVHALTPAGLVRSTEPPVANPRTATLKHRARTDCGRMCGLRAMIRSAVMMIRNPVETIRPASAEGLPTRLSVRTLTPFAAAMLLTATPIAEASPCPARWIAGPGQPGGGTPINATGRVNALAVLASGDVFVGGNYSNPFDPPGRQTVHIALYAPARNVWSIPSELFFSSDGNGVAALLPLADGTLIVGGDLLATASLESLHGIGRYDPNINRWTPVGAGVGSDFGPDSVFALARLANGDIMAGGRFSPTGAPTGGIARYRPSTNTWAFPAGSRMPVLALTGLLDGDVIVGGAFYWSTFPIANLQTSYIARYRPATNTWSAIGSGMNGDVRALITLPDGDVVAAGDFTVAGGVPASRIARYNPTTNTWSPFGTGTNGTVRALNLMPSGDVLVGGDFTTAGGVATRGIARYSPASNTWSALDVAGQGVAGSVRAIAVLPGGDIIVGGSFNAAGGIPVNNIARYTFGGTCQADFDCSASTTAADVFGFLNAWFARNARADLSTPADGVNVGDIFSFLSLWFAGCP